MMSYKFFYNSYVQVPGTTEPQVPGIQVPGIRIMWNCVHFMLILTKSFDLGFHFEKSYFPSACSLFMESHLITWKKY